jgi:hypothetical protein
MLRRLSSSFNRDRICFRDLQVLFSSHDSLHFGNILAVDVAFVVCAQLAFLFVFTRALLALERSHIRVHSHVLLQVLF